MVLETRWVMEDYKQRMAVHKIWSAIVSTCPLAKDIYLRSHDIMLKCLRKACFVDLERRERNHGMLRC
jgi:hypothetical protein